MKVAFYNTKEYDSAAFGNGDPLEITYLQHTLDAGTAKLAAGHDAVCIFVNDRADAETLKVLHEQGIKTIALRCAGFNNVDLNAAKELGITVVRVPAYSPEAVAEFAVGTILTVVRKYHKAYNRVREGNFLLNGLVGFNLQGKTIGIIGTGKIGMRTGKILSRGFEAHVIAYDPYPDSAGAQEAGITYVDLKTLLSTADVISLHCPLLPSTKYILNKETLAQTKPGIVIVNTSRGALIETDALIQNLKSGHVSAVGLDVYEHEEEYFFKDGSGTIMHDDLFSRLLSFHNVFVSGHQAFLTKEALDAIAQTTVSNLDDISKGKDCPNVVRA
ncbi:D-lactate dehydrogenase [Rickenella mellea]|uniref:D-lactate dehydrogenase n=1 Tax=Rickenella mellea TaxID=50990 RepID=A0A4Y7Q7N1_9AGAM|nr:D-lactate dehydrogenase [Rickenella mellea]